MTENVTLNFAKVAVDYTGQDEKGESQIPGPEYDLGYSGEFEIITYKKIP